MKNSAYLFAQEVDRLIEELSSDDYLRHENRGKKLLEEILPISRLALHLKQPGLEIEVEAFENDGEADGHIYITGFREDDFNTQVICDFRYAESLRRELFVSKGYAPGTGEIRRDKKSKEIVTNVATFDTDEYITRISQSLIKLFKKKHVKSYNENTVLIISFDDAVIYGHYNWCRLFDVIKRECNLSASKFKAIYLFNKATNEIQIAHTRAHK